MLAILCLNFILWFAGIGPQLTSIGRCKWWLFWPLPHRTRCYFHRNRRLPIRRRPEFPMRLSRDWSWLSTSAPCTELYSPLICPVHTPIRRRREGWEGESGGHVASPKDTQWALCPRNMPCCIHLYRGLHGAGWDRGDKLLDECLEANAHTQERLEHWTPLSTQAHLILPIFGAACCPSILALRNLNNQAPLAVCKLHGILQSIYQINCDAIYRTLFGYVTIYQLQSWNF